MHVGLGRQLKDTEAICAEEDMPIDSSPHCTQELPEENFIEVVLAALGVKNCHGCKGQINRKKMPAPKDLVFHMQAFLIWRINPQNTTWHQCYGNNYFHLTMSCVQKTTK